MADILTRITRPLPLLCIMASTLVSVVFAQAPRSIAPPSHTSAPTETVSSSTITHVSQFPPRSTRRRSPYSSLAVSYRARDYYRLVWGVDLLSAKLGESGQIVRFSYRIID